MRLEPGALWYTVVPPTEAAPTTMKWIAAFTDAAAHDAHAKEYHEAFNDGLGPLLFASVSDPGKDIVCHEYANAVHSERYKERR